MNECNFCLENLKTDEIILQNSICTFIQSKESAVNGLGLIIPHTHRETAFDLSSEEWAATFDLLKVVKEYLDDKHHPDGYNIGWNCGAIGGQHVFHAHMHVIPRYSDEPFAGKGIRYWFAREENTRRSAA
jgi:histidine triad (HIT) family protein